MFDRANVLPTMMVIRQMSVAIASFRFRVMGELLLSELRELAVDFPDDPAVRKTTAHVIAGFYSRQLRKIASATVKRATVTCHHRSNCSEAQYRAQHARIE
jgi:hypothetical protein